MKGDGEIAFRKFLCTSAGDVIYYLSNNWQGESQGTTTTRTPRTKAPQSGKYPVRLPNGACSCSSKFARSLLWYIPRDRKPFATLLTGNPSQLASRRIHCPSTDLRIGSRLTSTNNHHHVLSKQSGSASANTHAEQLYRLPLPSPEETIKVTREKGTGNKLTKCMAPPPVLTSNSNSPW